MDSPWVTLPDLVLSNIFGHLGLLDRIKVGQVCKSWHHASACLKVWHSFYYSEDYVWLELMEQKTTIDNLKKFQQIHDHLKNCIQDFGRHIRHVYIYLKGKESYEIFYKIAECCTSVVTFTLCKHKASPLSEEFRVALHSFFQKNTDLQATEIEDVCVKPPSRNYPLPIGHQHAQKMQKLAIINSFQSYSLSMLMYLVRLEELTINPHSLYFSLVDNLASFSLRKLSIVANRQTQEFFFENLSESQWKDISKHKQLRVHCYMSVSHNWAEKETLLKPSMPLVTFVNRKCAWLQYEKLCSLLANYSNTLEEFVDYSINEGSYINAVSASFLQRQDQCIINIVRDCPKLHTLAVKECLSSSTLLLLAFLNRSLTNLYIREDMIKYENDLPDDMVLPPEAKELVSENWERDKLACAMSAVLDYTWTPIPKTDYIKLLQAKYSRFLGF